MSRSEPWELRFEDHLEPGSGDPVTRRSFLRGVGGAVAASSFGASARAQIAKSGEETAVSLSQLHAATEIPEKTPGPFEAPDQRIGYAVVGLGHLALNQILPAMGKSSHSRVTALVSGDREKALKIAAQYGVPQGSIYDYKTYDQLAANKDVQAIYIVLPNSMHAEFVLRGAKCRKHILCEKPMATSARDCQHMIDACKAADVKLMIAYRQQYEPMNREIAKLVKAGKLGKIKSFVASKLAESGRSEPVAAEAGHVWRRMPAGRGDLLLQRGPVSDRGGALGGMGIDVSAEGRPTFSSG